MGATARRRFGGRGGRAGGRTRVSWCRGNRHAMLTRKVIHMDVVQVSQGYVVGWGTLSLINAGLAQSKGRSRMAWFLASLLLGPVATFIIVVTDDASLKVGK